MKRLLFSAFFALALTLSRAEDGYRLWLRYDKIGNAAILRQYRSAISGIAFTSSSPNLNVAKSELQNGLQHLLDQKTPFTASIINNCIVAGTPSSAAIKKILSGRNVETGKDGYAIFTSKYEGKNIIAIIANGDAGILYGVFAFLRLLQTQQPIANLSILSIPKIQYRILDHWDNLNRTVERGYAGASIWNWHLLPDYIDERYIDYARANASIGINGSVLTNVNANSLVLTTQYLLKAKALADVFRPYGIKIYLTARFSAPVETGGLKTADPLDTGVQNWWKNKCTEIYSYIPDFGGFLVKANSEGQPGPQTYGRSHADGANMLADALEPHGGIVMWRAFVYDIRPQRSEESFKEGNAHAQSETIASSDRFMQAYKEFTPLDGKFRKNVIVQVKNGPIDFQPREPFSPLFGAMKLTPLMMELQLTQEYLGQGTHLIYEAPLFKEVLDADTYATGKGSFISKVIDGSLFHHALTGIAGVSNIGNERNWTNHPFGQANWYLFGRLAWDYQLSSELIAEEWIRQTFTNDKSFIKGTLNIMLASREAVVDYMTPLGLHHIMGTSHHYGPAPWVSDAGRADWNPVYYHRADSIGIGFDRTVNGSNGLAQYHPEVQKQWNTINSCDEKYLLWFHHVSWNFKMKSGGTLWGELCYRYNNGVTSVEKMQSTWNSLRKYIDEERFNQVGKLLDVQLKEAIWWRDACISYFQTFSKMPIPIGIDKPAHPLDYYKSLRFPLAPGIGGNL